VVLARVERFAYEVILYNIAAQEMKMLKVFGNGTVSPEIGNLDMYMIVFGQIN